MNWFIGIIAGAINALATGLQNLLHMTIYDVIAQNMMAHDPGFGQGSFTDVVGGGKSLLGVLNPFAKSFGALAAAFILVSVYIYAMSISGAASSVIQRERLKKGAVSLVVAVVLIFVGQPFAVMITQFFYHLSLYFLVTAGANQPLQLNTASGADALLGAVLNLFQVIMAFIVWVIYQFRALFLYVWVIFFPLAQAFYANDKTRPITKMWWTEWIYQMSIPFGQAVVFGLAFGMVGKNSSSSDLSLAQIFAAIAGTVGLLGSAVYMRKLVDLVAQGFGATTMGHSAGESVGHGMAVGLGVGIGDKLGGAAVQGSTKLAGATAGKGLKALDRKVFGGAAKKAVEAAPETHATAIQNGASLDDVMMHHQMSANSRDPMRGAQGHGTEHASNHPRGGVLGGPRGGGYDGTFKAARTAVHSNTAGAFRDAGSSIADGFKQSNLATLVGTKWRGFQNQGGVRAIAGRKIAEQLPRNLGASYIKNQNQRSNKLENVRSQLRDTMNSNDNYNFNVSRGATSDRSYLHDARPQSQAMMNDARRAMMRLK